MSTVDCDTLRLAVRTLGLPLLVRRDPTRGMHRFCAPRVERDLLGGRALLREWGRVGSPGRVRADVFADEAAAAAAMARLERGKRRRGYVAAAARCRGRRAGGACGP